MAGIVTERGALPYGTVVYAPLYRNPKRIFGIGLNYVDRTGMHLICSVMEA